MGEWVNERMGEADFERRSTVKRESVTATSTFPFPREAYSLIPPLLIHPWN
jgi:hypothetical protein